MNEVANSAPAAKLSRYCGPKLSLRPPKRVRNNSAAIQTLPMPVTKVAMMMVNRTIAETLSLQGYKPLWNQKYTAKQAKKPPSKCLAAWVQQGPRSGHAVLMQPIERPMPAILRRFFAVAGAVIGMEGMGCIWIEHKLR